jgi:hypothetical protein
MKILIVLMISVISVSIVYAQVRPYDPSLSKNVKRLAPHSVSSDTAYLSKESVSSYPVSNQVSSPFFPKMKLAPNTPANAKVEEDRPVPPPIIYFIPEKKTSEIKQDPPHFK